MKTKNVIILCILFFLIFILFIAFISPSYIESFRGYHYNPNTVFTNHNVDLPINTYYSCKNKCGPKAQCSITREQCTSDIDCLGCQPTNIIVTPYDDAGKLIYNQNPRYSELTTDIGSKASLYRKKFARVPQPYLGLDKWIKSANFALQLQRDEYSYKYSTKPDEYKFIPHYPKRESVTGLFMDNGPLASNAYLQ